MQRNDALSAVAELAAAQHGAFNKIQAADRGLSRRQIQGLGANPLLDEPVRGVLRFLAAPRTWHQRMMIATLAGPNLHAGFRAAAYLHRIDGFTRRPPTPEIVGPRGARAVRGIDVIQHWVDPLEPDDLVIIDGIPCTGLARSVVDVCGLGDRDRSLRAVDHLERSGASINWLRLTAERLHRPGQSGTGVVLELLDRRQRGGRVPDSWFERLVERCLEIPGLPPWVCQHPVLDDGGRVIAHIDLACPALLYGVEADSREFHLGQRPEALDQRRENRASTVGWQLTYVGWYDTEDPAVVAQTVGSIARRRAALLGLSLPLAGS